MIATFFFGLFVGVYFYVGNVAGLADQVSVPDAETVASFTITSEVYGGCRTSCPAFHIEYDGSYRYRFTPGAGREQVVREGVLPRSLRARLERTLTETALAPEAKVVQPAVCNSYTDGIDVRYNITVAGNTYRLDSCGTAVDSDGVVWASLRDLWDYFEGR